MHDTETTAQHLKEGKLTTSEAAGASEADRFEKAQRTWWEGVDDGEGVDATSPPPPPQRDAE
jgi:hypothetical protein